MKDFGGEGRGGHTTFRWPCKAKRRHAELAEEQQKKKVHFEQMDRQERLLKIL